MSLGAHFLAVLWRSFAAQKQHVLSCAFTTTTDRLHRVEAAVSVIPVPPFCRPHT